MTPKLYSNLDRALQGRIVALNDQAKDLSAAVSAYLAGTAPSIDFVYSQVHTLALEARAVLESLTALSTPPVEGIERLRNLQRWLQRLYASPEAFITTFERQAAAYAQRGGPAYLSILLKRRLRRYMVCDGDTPQSVSQVQLGDAARWQEITLLNGLSYPFFTDDSQYASSTRATGVVRFSHVSAQASDYTIPAGTLLSTRETADRPAVFFLLQSDVTILQGELFAEGTVEALDPGAVGNVGPGEITVIVSTGAQKAVYEYTLSVTAVDVAGNRATVTRPFRHSAYPAVTNLEATSGGASGTVARSGEWILLPVETQVAGTSDILQLESLTDVKVRQYGIDWWINEDGELDRDQTGDVRAVSGLDNLALAIWCACQIERGDLTWHATYGSTLHKLVGVLDRPSLGDEVNLAIREAVVPDPRVKDASGVVRRIEAGRIEVSVEYETEELFDPGTLNLVVGAQA